MDSFISWIGGKRLLRKEICSRFPNNKFDRYVEVFGGAAWVLFYKEKHAELEVYNDLNGNLVNLFKCVKYHPNAVKEELEYYLNSREIFNDCKNLFKNNSLTDIQRAAMFYYMIKASYAFKLGSFCSKPRQMNEAVNLSKIQERLKTVNLENKSYEAIIKQYDRPTALFYCDPPYYGAEKFYDTGEAVFDESCHRNLRDILLNIKGRCIVSYNNDGFIKGLYKGFNISEIERQNNLGGRYGVNRVYGEVVITNY